MKWPWSRAGEQQLTWSTMPGPRERHLKRRHRNLLFPTERRQVSESEVLDARRADALELQSLREKSRDVLSAVASLPPRSDVETAMLLIDALEELWTSAVAEGTAGLELVRGIDEMQSELLSLVGGALATQPEVAEQLELATQMRMAMRRTHSTVMSDLQRVPPADVVASVLSESPQTISIFVEALSDQDEAVSVLREHGVRRLREAMAAGFPGTEAQTKANALGVVL